MKTAFSHLLDARLDHLHNAGWGLPEPRLSNGKIYMLVITDPTGMSHAVLYDNNVYARLTTLEADYRFHHEIAMPLRVKLALVNHGIGFADVTRENGRLIATKMTIPRMSLHPNVCLFLPKAEIRIDNATIRLEREQPASLDSTFSVQPIP